MKDLFSGFYGTSEAETKTLWNNRKSVFVFDTNALLLLYRCERETREAFFSQWEKIRDRVFLPYHVCLEYQRNRLTAIKDHVLELKNAGIHIAQRVGDASNLSQFDDKQATTIRRYESLRGKVTELSDLLKSTVDEFVKDQIDSRIREADFLTNHDTVRDRISELAASRIGIAPTQEIISRLESEGEERFKKQIPPGFEDAKTKGDQVFNYSGITYKRKYGDWFIWNEILSYTSENKPAAVIFVTNENKKDWLFETGGQTRGPLESLKTEVSDKGEGTHFLLYSSASFLFAANNHLKGKITSSKVIKELERASEESFKAIRKSDYLYELFKTGNKRLKNGVEVSVKELHNSEFLKNYDRYNDALLQRDFLKKKIVNLSGQLIRDDLSDEERNVIGETYKLMFESYKHVNKLVHELRNEDEDEDEGGIVV